MEIVVPAEYQALYVTDEANPIVKIPHDVLRQPAQEITKVNNQIRLLADNMVRIMKKANGVGLAAPQIGILKRIIVIAPEGKPTVLINPVITHREGSEIAEEGCLSIPGLYGDVERAETIEVEAYDIKGRAFSYTIEGFAARIVQHEVDHLDGVLFIDKVDPATLHWQDPNPENRPR